MSTMKTDETVVLSVRVDKARRNKIQAAAEYLGLTPSDFMRYLVNSASDAIITADSPDALMKKFQLLSEYFANMRLSEVAKRKLEGLDETEQEP